MQGLITLDFGNSYPNFALFIKKEKLWNLIQTGRLEDLNTALKTHHLTPSNSSIVLCEVRPRDEELNSLIQEGYLLTRVKDYWRGEKFAGMSVQYANTLGEDRLILAHYFFKNKKHPILLIDAGTFTTIDVVTHSGFIGGYIIPGSEAYFSIFSRGEKLKHNQLKLQKSNELPVDTRSAMELGYHAFVLLAKQTAQFYGIKNILVTGGQFTFWKEQLLKNSEFEVYEQPYSLHWGMLHWFTTQIELL